MCIIYDAKQLLPLFLIELEHKINNKEFFDKKNHKHNSNN